MIEIGLKGRNNFSRGRVQRNCNNELKRRTIQHRKLIDQKSSN